MDTSLSATPPSHPSWLALDIGGANLKVAHSSGGARTLPFELWKRPEDLPRHVAALAATLPPADQVALTMTAELCDCYPTKAVGVQAVVASVWRAVRGRPLWVWGLDGRFHEPAEILETPLLAAAANWLALASVAARLVPEGPGLLIDIGTTTTDVIPLADGRAVPRGRTDTERLQTGELVYAGMRRTPMCALATELPFRSRVTGLVSEVFATTLDVYLTLGEVASDPSDMATADGRPATAEAARDRLARMVGTDRDCFTPEDARALAAAADEVLLNRLIATAERVVSEALGDRPRRAILAGSGEFLAHRLAERIVAPGGAIVSLRDAWGPVASAAACAHALTMLAREGGRVAAPPPTVPHVESAPHPILESEPAA